MDANKILSADVLDILFDGRNKAYGAYELRKTYGQRLGKSLMIMCSLLLLLLGAHFLFGFMAPKNNPVIGVRTDFILKSIKIDEPKPPEPLPTPPPMRSRPNIKSVILTPPLIVKEAAPEERPPEMKETETARIALTNNPGGKDDDGSMLGPPGKKEGLVDVPKKKGDDDSRFIPIEKESEFPGGPEAWKRFLERNLFNNLPQDAVDNNIQGTVLIRFVVDTDGTVSEISVVSGPQEYREVAVKAIRKSGKWIPALQNGHYVKTVKMQAITVRLEE